MKHHKSVQSSLPNGSAEDGSIFSSRITFASFACNLICYIYLRFILFSGQICSGMNSYKVTNRQYMEII